MSDKPIITLWMFVPARKSGRQGLAPLVTSIHYTAQHIAQRFNFPYESNALYFPTKEHAEEHLANYLAAQEESE